MSTNVPEHQSYWRQTEGAPRQPRLEGDLRAEVAVVGAGITGLTAARLLAAAGRRVVVLEQEAIGAGTSGSTSAHVTQVPDRRFHRLVSDFGRDSARRVVESTGAALGQIARFVQEDGIDCDFARIPAFLYTERGGDLQEIDREAEAASEAGMEARRLGPDEVPLPFRVVGAVRFEGQARFHAMKYLAGLARSATAAGARIFEGTRVREVRDGEPCRVETDRGVVSADRVLFATHTPAGLSLLHGELEPMRSYVMAVRLRDRRPPDGLFFDTAEPYRYTRLQPDPRGAVLIVGGADHHTGEGEPGESYRELEEYVRSRWDVESVVARWSAQLYEPPDGLPLIGGALSSSRVFLATGYSGTGLVFGTLGGMMMADAALGRPNPWEDLYRTSRLKPLVSGPELAKLNVHVATTFVRDRLEIPKVRDLSEVPAGEGRVVEWQGERVAVYREPSGATHAVSPVCTHALCIVHWNAAEKTWDCPCHGGRYTPEGRVIEGPPVEDLRPVAAATTAREP